MLNFLNGYKTQILMAVGAILTFAHNMGFIGFDLYTQLMILVGLAGGVTMHAAVVRESGKVQVAQAYVEQQVAKVDNRVAAVDNKVMNVGAKVADVEEKVAQQVSTPDKMDNPPYPNTRVPGSKY